MNTNLSSDQIMKLVHKLAMEEKALQIVYK